MPQSKKIIFSRKKLISKIKSLRSSRKRIVFTNGCYDILHAGHVRFLERAKKMGDILILALNSDTSVRKIKGPKRPVVPQAERAEVMAALSSVDIVTVFYEPDPYKIISDIKPGAFKQQSRACGDQPFDRLFSTCRTCFNRIFLYRLKCFKSKIAGGASIFVRRHTIAPGFRLSRCR